MFIPHSPTASQTQTAASISETKMCEGGRTSSSATGLPRFSDYTIWHIGTLVYIHHHVDDYLPRLRQRYDCQPESISFQLGMVLCSMTGVCHVSLVLVAGRAATQTYRSSRLPRNQHHPTLPKYEGRLEAFVKCLRLSKNIQALRTTIFSNALLCLGWYIFHNHMFMYTLFTFVIVTGVWI